MTTNNGRHFVTQTERSVGLCVGGLSHLKEKNIIDTSLGEFSFS